MNDADEDEIIVYFAVFDFGGDPSLITRAIGLEPTMSWSKGQLMPNSPASARATHDRWALESRLARKGSIEDQIQDLLPQLEARAEQIRVVAGQFRAAFRIACYLYNDFNPSWELTADVIRRLAALKLLVDFDFYFLGKD